MAVIIAALRKKEASILGVVGPGILRRRWEQQEGVLLGAQEGGDDGCDQ